MGPSRSPEALTPERASSPPPPADALFAPAAPPPPADDLMQMDFGNVDVRSGAPAAAPPPKVQMPDRNELVMQREAEKQRRIDEKAAQAKAIVNKEEDTKAGKIDANSKLAPVLDRWAKNND